MNSDDEHPDVDNINEMLDIAAEKMSTGYEVCFEITRYDAEVLLDTWGDASNGDVEAVYMLMAEMGKLVGVLEDIMGDDDDDYYDDPDDGCPSLL